MSLSESLPVMERFYTIQGEGVFSGAPAYFIRLAGCDVGCHWCDVKESWNAADHPKISINQLIHDLKASGAAICVVTGGEPAMYDLTTLTNAIQSIGVRTHIETSGVYELTGNWDWVTFSPKKFKQPHPSIYERAHELKVIVYHPSDIDWAQTHAEQAKSGTALFLQPEWSKKETVQPMILDFIRTHTDWRISIQIHKYMGVD